MTGTTDVLTNLLRLDGELWGAIALTMFWTLLAVLIAGAVALPMAYWLTGDPDTRESGLRKLGTELSLALISLPSIAIGLLVYLLVSGSGPLGFLGLVYSPLATGLLLILLAIPVLTGLFAQVFLALPRELTEMALCSGANRRQLKWDLIWHARPALVASCSIGWARLLGEAGAIGLVGASVAGSTRLMPTAVALEIQRGEWGLAFGLSLVLVGMALVVNVATRRLRQP